VQGGAAREYFQDQQIEGALQGIGFGHTETSWYRDILAEGGRLEGCTCVHLRADHVG
jgi:hypothetical protein